MHDCHQARSASIVLRAAIQQNTCQQPWCAKPLTGKAFAGEGGTLSAVMHQIDALMLYFGARAVHKAMHRLKQLLLVKRLLRPYNARSI